MFFKKDESHRIAINPIGLIWDANKVWLIIGGGALFAGFLMMYATMLSAIYIPFMLFLMLLILRSVAIKFRSTEEIDCWRKMLSIIYFASNTLIAFLLGVVLGNVLRGFPLGQNYSYQGGIFFAFLIWNALMTGIHYIISIYDAGSHLFVIKKRRSFACPFNFFITKRNVLFMVSFAITSLYTLVFVPKVTDNFKKNPIFFILTLLLLLVVANVPLLVSKK